MKRADMQNSFLVLLLFLFSSPSFGVTFDNHCEFYLKADKHLNCSNDPDDQQKYLVKYGYRLCKKYSEKQENWDIPLQNFITQVAPCLQNEIAELMTTNITCEALGKKAFASHSGCYIQSGFCELSFSDKMKVFNVAMELNLILSGSWNLGYQLWKECQ